MTLEEWVDTQVAEAPHLFEANAGSGAASNGFGGAGQRAVRNPFRKETWNLTEQMGVLNLKRADGTAKDAKDAKEQTLGTIGCPP